MDSFIRYTILTRSHFTWECNRESWWDSLPADRRVMIEDLLIAYDQMQETIKRLQPAKEILRALVNAWDEEGGEACDWNDGWLPKWKKAVKYFEKKIV